VQDCVDLGLFISKVVKRGQSLTMGVGVLATFCGCVCWVMVKARGRCSPRTALDVGRG
jgi:hypothetical protein